MAHENKYNGLRGQTDYWLTIHTNDSGTMKVYDVAAGSGALVAWNTANQDDYDIAFTERSPGEYTNTFPADLPAGVYDRKIRKGSKADADTTHEIVGGDTIYWDGTTVYDSEDIFDIKEILGIGGSGNVTHTYTVLDEDTNPIPDVLVEAKVAGVVIQTQTTDTSGEAAFYLAAGTYDFYATKAGFDFTNPDTEVVS